MGELFGINQSAANQQIHRLLPVLREALTAIGVMPERDGEKFAQAERRQAMAADYLIDGTERARQRPKNPAKQALHYNGKKKRHSERECRHRAGALEACRLSEPDSCWQNT